MSTEKCMAFCTRLEDGWLTYFSIPKIVQKKCDHGDIFRLYCPVIDERNISEGVGKRA